MLSYSRSSSPSNIRRQTARKSTSSPGQQFATDVAGPALRGLPRAAWLICAVRLRGVRRPIAAGATAPSGAAASSTALRTVSICRQVSAR